MVANGEVAHAITSRAGTGIDAEDRHTILGQDVSYPVLTKWSKGAGAPNATGGDRPPGTQVDTAGSLIAFDCKRNASDSAAEEVSPTLRAQEKRDSNASGGGEIAVAFQLNGDRDAPGVSVSEGAAFTLPANPMSDRGQAVAFKASHFTRGKDGAPSDVTPPLSADADKGDQDPLVAFAQNQREEVRQLEVAGALAGEPGMKQQTFVAPAMQVRRLTPRECERLQGFRDDYTLITFRKKPAADGPRYKALGNSMAVPVMGWLGRRIEAVDAILAKADASR